MRKTFTLLFAFCLLSSLSLSAQELWDDFDNPENCVYGFFNGTSFNQSFANPSTGGINTSALCAEYARDPGSPFDVIIIDPAGSAKIGNIADYASGAKTMSLKVYSPAPGIPIQITLEDPVAAQPTNFPTGRHSEYTGTTSTTNQWETITLTFSNRPDPAVSDTSANRMVLLFDPGANSSTVFIWDDLMGPEFVNPCGGIPTDPAIADDAECQQNVSYDFTNGTLVTVANPNPAGINTSGASRKFFKFTPPLNDGAFGGSLSNSFTTADYNRARIQLYDPSAPQEFRIIFQDGNGNDVFSDSVSTSSTTDWESFEVDLSNVPATTTITNFVFLLNPTTATEDSIVFDNFTLDFVPVGISSPVVPENVRVFPVPFENELNVMSDERMQRVWIADLQGRILMDYPDLKQLEIEIDTESLVPGVYVVTVEDLQGNWIRRKLIKQ